MQRDLRWNASSLLVRVCISPSGCSDCSNVRTTYALFCTRQHSKGDNLACLVLSLSWIESTHAREMRHLFAAECADRNSHDICAPSRAFYCRPRISVSSCGCTCVIYGSARIRRHTFVTISSRAALSGAKITMPSNLLSRVRRPGMSYANIAGGCSGIFAEYPPIHTHIVRHVAVTALVRSVTCQALLLCKVVDDRQRDLSLVTRCWYINFAAWYMWRGLLSLCYMLSCG